MSGVVTRILTPDSNTVGQAYKYVWISTTMKNHIVVEVKGTGVAQIALSQYRGLNSNKTRFVYLGNFTSIFY